MAKPLAMGLLVSMRRNGLVHGETCAFPVPSGGPAAGSLDTVGIVCLKEALNQRKRLTGASAYSPRGRGLDVPDRSTIYEVAQRSGVSTATGSRATADGKGFSEATGRRGRATA